MRALQHTESGPSTVLSIADLPEPHAGPGQVRIAVRAASVNPVDLAQRAGHKTHRPLDTFPAIPGTDAAGIVDEIGAGVTAVRLGDAVFGSGLSVSAEFAVLDNFELKPDFVSFEEAAAIPMVAETAARTLADIPFEAGDTILINGASGGVGSAAVQLAVARGAHVIGTASEPHHTYLRSLGATPTTYGPGLPDRVRALTNAPIAAAFDIAGGGNISELVAITGSPDRVVSIADFSAPEHGVRLEMGDGERFFQAYGEVISLIREGRYSVAIENTFDLADGALAHDLVAGGHVQGKVVLTI